MPRCFELFCESGFQGKTLQILADRAFPNFACEREQCSPHSPGPVNDNEELAFLLINPLHYDEERDVVVPGAFQELTNRDLSVLRLSYATQREAYETRDELVARGNDRIPPQMRAVGEVCIAPASDLRRPVSIYGRLVGVFDTALDDKPSHASLFTTEPAFSQRRLRKAVREHVHSVMTRQRVKFSEFINSLPEAS